MDGSSTRGRKICGRNALGGLTALCVRPIRSFPDNDEAIAPPLPTSADHCMLQMLVQNLQLLYHNTLCSSCQVDKNYMNYMLLNPPRRINRRATRQPWPPMCIVWRKYSATYRAGICTASPAGRAISCGRTRFLSRYRVDGRLF